MKKLLLISFLFFVSFLSHAQLSLDTVTIESEHIPSPLDSFLGIKGGKIVVTVVVRDLDDLGRASFDLYNESGNYYAGGQYYLKSELESGGYLSGNVITVSFPVFNILSRYRVEVTCQNAELLYIAPVSVTYEP